jgi:hypothetical protein
MTIEEIVYARIVLEQQEINKKRGDGDIFDESDAKWKLHRMAREDFLKLLSEAIEDRLHAFAYDTGLN